MTMIFGIMDKLMDIVEYSVYHCFVQFEQAEVFRPTLKSPILRAITTETANRKRKNHHQHVRY
ncbi:hypothetical protein BDF20DRAFT_854911 [Mycotypha africana]|uniref:uncharacterized protein n=1 Tax=Mycotypha africana TaxID=64632 RepID=UPI0023000B4D|nr:uncharacterized protein BDF20DRAFT_854911 [Mycotypha africana]KAI8988282.1 hypothetical protein BDF20DRAFT_854911 [Mycotypha africana]